MCTYLIEQGAEVNAFRGIVPSTPLQWAAREGLVKVIDLLIQHGANPSLVDSQDFSCLHSVTHSSDHWALLYSIYSASLTSGSTRGTIWVSRHCIGHWAAQQGDELPTEVLLKFGADPNAADHNGLTALHWAASSGNWSCISQLLEAGADIRAKTRNHRKVQEIAVGYDKAWIWDSVDKRLGFKVDGTRMRRPLCEICGFQDFNCRILHCTICSRSLAFRDSGRTYLPTTRDRSPTSG